MKLFTILGSATVPLTLAADGPNPNCKLADLGEPEFFKQWECISGGWELYYFPGAGSEGG